MCKVRDIAKEGHIHNIEDKMWIKEDKERFRTDFKPQIYRKGDVRISSPLLPHGSTRPATKIRQTMLPWYIAIQDDYNILDITESSNWDLFFKLYRDFETPDFSSFGKLNIYTKTPYVFPSAIRINNLNTLSDTLLGQRK